MHLAPVRSIIELELLSVGVIASLIYIGVAFGSLLIYAAVFALYASKYPLKSVQPKLGVINLLAIYNVSHLYVY